MEQKKLINLTLASAIVINCVGVGYGVHLFTDLPPLAAVSVAASSSVSFTGAGYLPVYATPVYNSVTDEQIEAPVIEQDKVEQS
jgi:hypothetical protein